MNQEIKTRWLQALRSGQYKQAYGTLKRTTAEGSSFCCLGVLCDVIKEDLKIDWQPSTTYPNSKSFDGNTTILTSGICQYCQLEPDYTNHVITMNDNERASFEQIADYIEANY